MTVQELIAELSKYPSDYEVAIEYSDTEYDVSIARLDIADAAKLFYTDQKSSLFEHDAIVQWNSKTKEYDKVPAIVGNFVVLKGV